MKVLLYFTNPEIADLLGFALENHFLCEVEKHNTVATAAPVLKAGVAVAVFDGNRDDTLPLVETLKGTNAGVVLFQAEGTGRTVVGVECTLVHKESDLLPAVTEVIRKLGGEFRQGELAPGKPLLPFMRVGVPLLLRTNPLVADVYIRLSELKFVKLFHKGAEYTQADVDKYQGRKNVQHFYVRREDAEAVTKRLNDVLEALLKQVPPPKKAVTTAVSASTIEVIHDLVNQVGFTEEVQRLVKNEVELVLSELANIGSLGNILKGAEQAKDKYIGAHSHMLAEVACALSIAMEWQSETSFKKLSMAALLHDMTLSDQKLCRVKDLKDLQERRNEFSSSDVEEYRGHPRRASTMIQGIKEVPADVDKIVLQHHELPIGTGFPEQVTHVHIHPMASLMIVAHDLVDWVIDHPGKPDIPAFVDAHTEKYRTGNFKKILKALETLEA